MAYQQSEKTFAEIGDTISEYLDARDWLDNPSRSVAMSIVLEAAELMEHYQWSSDPVGSRDELAAELADILIYTFQFAQSNQIDLADAILKKLEKTKKKYPAEAFKNKDAAQMHQAWVDAKQHHKKEETL
ncbi:MAG TPA: MazG-like family protein [Candidatus Saccharimonadales bacterium]|nr:MazG-like family protein [Candidatus Saccharimonadales bacterium]